MKRPHEYSNLKEFMMDRYPVLSEKLENTFPEMVYTAEEVKIIEWQDDFAVADKNPELIDVIEFYNMMAEEGLMSREEADAEIRKVAGNSYASKTVAVAFNDEKEVSFREFPNFATVLHELGHIHFQEPDVIWGRQYGGGENFVIATLKFSEKEPLFTERDVEIFHELVRRTLSGRHLEVARMMGDAFAEGIRSDVNGYPSFYKIYAFAGLIPPTGINNSNEALEPKKEDVISLLQNLSVGALTGEPMSTKIAKIIFNQLDTPDFETSKNIDDMDNDSFGVSL